MKIIISYCTKTFILITFWSSYLCMHAKSPQLCLTFCNRMVCSPPGFSVHWFLQTRILEWVAMPSSSGSSQRRARTLSLKTCIFREGCGNARCFHDFLGSWLNRWPWGTSSEKIPPGSMVSTTLQGLRQSLLHLSCLRTPESMT